jgi:hypothetical protein
MNVTRYVDAVTVLNNPASNGALVAACGGTPDEQTAARIRIGRRERDGHIR